MRESGGSLKTMSLKQQGFLVLFMKLAELYMNLKMVQVLYLDKLGDKIMRKTCADTVLYCSKIKKDVGYFFN
jgi:hypothetical protein